MSDPQQPTTPSQQAIQTGALDMDHQRRAFATQQDNPQSAGLGGPETVLGRSTTDIRSDLADLTDLIVSDRHGPNTLGMLATLVCELASAVDDLNARMQRLESHRP